MKRQQPFPPPDQHATVRRQLLERLVDGPFTVRDLSVSLGLAEKEIYPHLEHLQRSLRRSGQKFVVSPASCRKCGFVFRKRFRLAPPGRCPACRSESISLPQFAVADR